MVRNGPRPAHRRGTAGRDWRTFRKRLVDKATVCQNPDCGKLLIRDAACTHPTHRGLPGCPTHHAYPTLEHPHRLIDGGHPRDPGNALVYCFECNSRDGRPRAGAKPQGPGPSRRW